MSQSTSDDKTCADASLDYDVEKILELIKEGTKKILGCKDMRVVVFIGKTGTGKTTLCAGLIFGVLNLDKNGIFSPKEQKENCSFPDLGVVGGGKACTILPQAFVFGEPKPEFILLDTMGLFDNNIDKNSEIASYFLLRKALDMASEIKVVSVENHSVYSIGLSSLNQIGEVWSHLITKDDVPILFVYNRFNPKAGREQEKWTAFQTERNTILRGGSCIDSDSDSDSVSDSELESESETHLKSLFELDQKKLDDLDKRMNDYALKHIVKQLKIMEGEHKKIEDGFDKRRKEKSLKTGYDEDKIDPEEEECLKQMGYLSLMRKNFDEGNVAYFDPTSRISIDLLLESIRKLKPIKPGDLNLDELCLKMDNFKKKVNERIPELVNVLKGMVFIKKHGETSAQARINQMKGMITQGRHQLEDIETIGQKGDSKEDAKARISELNEKIRKGKVVIEKSRMEIKELQGKIRVIEQGCPQKYREFHVGLAAWKINCYVEYDDIPFVDVVERLEKGVVKEKVFVHNPECGRYRAKYTFKSFGNKVLSWLGWMKDAPKKENTGCIEIRVYQKDIPENKKLLEMMKKSIEDLEHSIEEDDKEREENIEEREREMGTLAKLANEEEEVNRKKERVASKLSSYEKDIFFLENFVRFSKQMEDLFKTKDKAIELYYSFYVNMFCFHDEKQPFAAQVFMELVDELKSINESDGSDNLDTVSPKHMSIETDNLRRDLKLDDDN